MSLITIQQFVEGLDFPTQSLREVVGGGAIAFRNEAGEARICCLTHLVEAQAEMDRKIFLVALPQTAEVRAACRKRAARLATIRLSCLADYRFVPDGLQRIDSMGQVVTDELVVERLPEGRPLSEVLPEGCRANSLIKALRRMQKSFVREQISHNNLKAENLWLTTDGELMARRCHCLTFEGVTESDTQAFSALEELIRAADNGFDEEPIEGRLRNDSEYAHVGRMADGLICICREGLYGYLDSCGEVAIEPCFLWADNFREGRAEVECESGFGVIDKEGNFVLNPCFEDIEWDDMQGTIRAKLSGRWMLFGYGGEPLVLPETKR